MGRLGSEPSYFFRSASDRVVREFGTLEIPEEIVACYEVGEGAGDEEHEDNTAEEVEDGERAVFSFCECGRGGRMNSWS